MTKIEKIQLMASMMEEGENEMVGFITIITLCIAVTAIVAFVQEREEI